MPNTKRKKVKIVREENKKVNPTNSDPLNENEHFRTTESKPKVSSWSDDDSESGEGQPNVRTVKVEMDDDSRGRKSSGLALEEIHLRHVMMYEYRHGNSATAATRHICEAYGDVLKVNKCQRWFRKFSTGNYDLTNKHRSGRPIELDNERLRTLIESDPRQTIRELSDRLNNSWSTVQEHLQQIDKVNRQGVWVPRQLSERSKSQRIVICNSLTIRQRNDPFLHRIVTCDEKWIAYDHSKRENQYREQLNEGERSPERKILLCIWWDCRGIVYYELVESDQRVTVERYCEQLDNLRLALMKTRPALINSDKIILHHDNAHPWADRKVQEKIRDMDWDLLPHPPDSFDLIPSDYHLFRTMQYFLAGKTFRNRSDVDSALARFFSTKSPDFYQEGIDELPKRWIKVIECDGDYIE